MNDCNHDTNITRYTTGLFCHNCNKLFDRTTPEYRSREMLSGIWMTLNNINADSVRNGGPSIKDALAMRDEIGIGKKHANYEELIFRAELIMAKYGRNEQSSTITLKDHSGHPWEMA